MTLSIEGFFSEKGSHGCLQRINKTITDYFLSRLLPLSKLTRRDGKSGLLVFYGKLLSSTRILSMMGQVLEQVKILIEL